MASMALIALISVIYPLRFAIGYIAAIAEDLPIYRDTLINGFSNIRFFSQFQSWTLPLLMTAAVLEPTKKARFLWLTAAVLGWGLLFVSGTRGTLLGLVVSTIVVSLVFREYTRAYVSTVLICVISGIVCYILALMLTSYSGSDNTDIARNTLERDFTSSSGRYEIWLYSIRVALEHPWFGIGPMHLACKNHFNIAAHPHNIWLQFLSEWGIPFTLGITVGFFYLVYRWLSKLRGTSREARDLALPITASLSTALVHSLFSGVFVMPVSQFYGVLLFGWALAWYRGSEHLRRIKPRLLGLPLALPALILLGYVVYSLPDLSKREEAELLIAGYHSFHPRFWVQGKICLHKS